MINNGTVLGLITARGGSKGLPGKNIKPLCGKPLIGWTIEAALASKYIDDLILSSDSPEIMSVAVQFGCKIPFTRPESLATDEATSIDVACHALNVLQSQGRHYEYLVLLQPTSPLRETSDIDSCIELCSEANTMSVVSVCRSEKSPFWTFYISEKNQLRRILPAPSFSRRQDAPQTFHPNGAVYVARVNHLLERQSFIDELTVGYIMPRERSIDIDTEIDFQLAALIMSASKQR